MKPAIFLDRDGVIIENIPDYVRSWSQVKLLSKATTALRNLAKTPYQIVIVTNQSAVGRHIISITAAQEINRRLVQVIHADGGRVDAVFMCPHSPEDGCSCRKPAPGLLLRAAKALSIDLSRSIMVGDALSDIQAGNAAGICRSILVLTGRGQEQYPLVKEAMQDPVWVYPSLHEFTNDLLTTNNLFYNR